MEPSYFPFNSPVLDCIRSGVSETRVSGITEMYSRIDISIFLSHDALCRKILSLLLSMKPMLLFSGIPSSYLCVS